MENEKRKQNVGLTSRWFGIGFRESFITRKYISPFSHLPTPTRLVLIEKALSIQPSQSVVMYCRWPTLIVLDAAQEALAQALIEHKDDLRGDLRTQEGRLLHPVAGVCRSGSAWAAGCTSTSSVAPASPCGAGCVAVAALILPLREVLGRFKSLHRRWGL
ncbi:hypothetical protein VTN02DRAFT_1250 [Thermoascus thermophilus]